MEIRKTLKPRSSLCLILSCLLWLAGSARAGTFLMNTEGNGAASNNAKAASLGHTVTTDTLANITAMSVNDLLAFDVVWFNPGNGIPYATLQAAVANGGSLESYASAGGTLVLCVAGNAGNQTDIAPGGVDYDRSITHNAETFTTPAHPYLTGIGYGGTALATTDFGIWNFTDHGWLTSLPAGETTVLSNDDGPSWVQYPWGCGDVIVTTLIYGWTAGAQGVAQDNLINYADFTVKPVHNLTQNSFHGSLQAAIDAAVNGDEIEACARTYHEAIDFLGKAITLRSASGDPADTIIDGGGNSRVVQCVNGEGPDTILEGFTITAGNAGNGGGMYNSSSNPTVTYCVFSGNTADFGGGMFNLGSSPTVSYCIFTGNSASAVGGGMYNTASSSPTVTHCSFSGNTSTNSGGGMSNVGNCNPALTHCTFSGNTAISGGGMYNQNSGNPTVTNCILWGDLPDEIVIDLTSTPTISFSDVQGVLPAGTIDGGGNIDADPLFVNAAGDDLRLLAGSLCIDTGNNAAIPAGITTDLDGNPRIRNGTVDRGAYEFGDRVHNLNQNTYYSNIQPAIVAAANGQVIEAEPSTYYEAINFLGKAITVRSTSGGPNDTIIDGTGSLHVVQCVTNETAATVLSGFTITGGNANGGSGQNIGGGMYNLSASPTVTHCIFSGNAADNRGGGMYNATSSSPTVTHCTFSGNSTSVFGGGMRNFDSSPALSNCILWGDSPDEIVNDGAGDTPIIRFSDLQGGLPVGAIDGGGNIDADPLFVDADGADDTIGTDDDDLRLLAGSPCIDSASYFDFNSIFDLGGKVRYVDDPTTMNTGTGVFTFLDMGPYEFHCSGIPGDINCDGIVNEHDFALMAINWLETI